MTKDEALKIALQALKTIDEAMPFPVAKLAQAAIKEALAQPEQEPVAFSCLRCVTPKKCAIHGCSPNTWPSEALPQRKPLTDEDCTRIYNEANDITTKNPPITTERVFKAMRAAHGIKGEA